jgi:hypothetical protein
MQCSRAKRSGLENLSAYFRPSPISSPAFVAVRRKPVVLHELVCVRAEAGPLRPVEHERTPQARQIVRHGGFEACSGESW